MSDDTRSFEDVRDEVTGETFEAFGVTFSVCEVCEEAVIGDVERCNNCEGYKHTTGTIDGHGFSLRVDGDAPDELVAEIEAALADLKAGGYTPTDKLKILATQWQKAAYSETRKEKYTPVEVNGLVTAANELEALIDNDTQAGDGE